MKIATRALGLAGALAYLAGASAAQAGLNDAGFNNGSDVLFTYSDPSSGFTSGAVPPDFTGDLFYFILPGSSFMNDVDSVIGSAMEIDGYLETISDTDWSTPPDFYNRMHGPAVPDSLGLGGLEPAFFTLGQTTEIQVLGGPSGLTDPCLINPALCTVGGLCAPPGFINGYTVELELVGATTPGSGIVLPADGTSASDMATTYFVTGGMSSTGGACGAGDYAVQDAHSTDETPADTTGNGTNPYGGAQFAGSGPLAEGITDANENSVQFKGNVVTVVADTGTGLGAETATNGGGAMNGRHLSAGGGFATMGVHVRDNLAPASNLTVVGASLTPLMNPGVPALGGNLLVLPDGLFNGTSGSWQGPAVPMPSPFFVGVTETIFEGIQLAVPVTAIGATLNVQGAVFDLGTFQIDSTNAVTTTINA